LPLSSDIIAWPRNTPRGEEAEKQYIYIRGKYPAILLAAIFLIMLLVAVLFPGHQDYVGYVC